MHKIKIGVIGTGHLGKFHAKLLKDIEQADLRGICDTNKEQMMKVAEEFELPTFDSFDDLLREVDAVSIAATTSAHFDLAKQCLNAGKHVMIEKPITATIDQGKELVQLAKEKNLKLQVGHIERFNPALLSLEKKYQLDPKFIQTDRLAPFTPRGADVAVVLDLMIHDIDIILSLVKSEVKKIDANGVAVVSDTIDIANARIEFENGAVAIVTSSRISQKKMRKMRIFQRDHYISLDFNTGASEVYRLMPSDETPPENFMSFGEIGVGDKKKKIVFELPEQVEVNALKYELSLFTDSIINNTEPAVSGEDGLKALIVADSIITKIEESLKIVEISD